LGSKGKEMEPELQDTREEEKGTGGWVLFVVVGTWREFGKFN
jgi:hypothetical protein